MPVLEDAKKIAEQITGWRRPDKPALDSLGPQTQAAYVSL